MRDHAISTRAGSNGGGHDALGVEGRAGLQHVVDGAGELGGQDGVALVLAAPGGEPIGVGRQQGVVAFGDDGGLAEGPAQIGVAHLAAAEALDLSGAGDGAFDQPAVAEEVLVGRETLHGIHFVEDRQTQHPSDARRGQYQPVVAFVVRLGQMFELLVQHLDLGVVGLHDFHVARGAEPVQRVLVLLQDALFPDLPVVSALGGGDEPLSHLVHRQVRQQLRALPDVAHALAQQSPDRAAGGRIDIGRRNQVGPQQVGELLRVNAVVLVLAAVDVLEVQRVRQHELDPGREACVRQPVPVERAFADDRQVVQVRLHQLQEEGEVIAPDVAVEQNPAFPVHNAHVHLFRVQVDSAVEFCFGRVILHLCLSSLSVCFH